MCCSFKGCLSGSSLSTKMCFPIDISCRSLRHASRSFSASKNLAVTSSVSFSSVSDLCYDRRHSSYIMTSRKVHISDHAISRDLDLADQRIITCTTILCHKLKTAPYSSKSKTRIVTSLTCLRREWCILSVS